VSFSAAAALPIAGLTALRALRVDGSLIGKRVLITGASGGVGSFAVQLARLGGARVTGVVGHSERTEEVRRLGAEQVVPSIEGLDTSFDLILESVGGSSLASSIRHIAPDGTIVLFGNSSREPTALGFEDFFGHARARIYAFFIYESADRQTFGEDLSYLASLVGQGALDPQIGLEVSWRDIEQGIAALRTRQFSGKAVFEVD
jgi:NADPH:quinone reductase-like Zn-dependent oxidoreductase